ncbi:MAG: hypothetical protein ABI388_00205 [Bacteroidia bacterium]
MKEFLLKITLLLIVTLLILTASLFFIPDFVSKNSILGGLIDKHEKLKKIKTEKIIFVGGSNISFGLDSKKIVDKFNKPVVNMGVHAGMGLKFIMNDIKSYINKGDVVVLIPEYENFYTNNFYGEMELVSVLFDVDPSGKKLVDAKQWSHLMNYMPTYAAKKIKNYVFSPFQKQNISSEINIYDRQSFNEFGDAYIHWELPNQNYLPSKKTSGDEKINQDVISSIKGFKEYVVEKGAKFIFLPPVIESQSYVNQASAIDFITVSLISNSISFSVEPNRYKFSPAYFFNSYYHLNKKGVDKRTQLVIEDLENSLK